MAALSEDKSTLYIYDTFRVYRLFFCIWVFTGVLTCWNRGFLGWLWGQVDMGITGVTVDIRPGGLIIVGQRIVH